jgi:hypothetical protein
VYSKSISKIELRISITGSLYVNNKHKGQILKMAVGYHCLLEQVQALSEG